MSCEDKIRWEIFRPLSSPLNSVVSFSPASHQKGNVAVQTHKTREKAENGVGEVWLRRETIMFDTKDSTREKEMCACV